MNLKKTKPEVSWNEWLRLARQGDENAKLLFCAQAEPFIGRFCNNPFFAETLGKEEVRSIATLALVEFLMKHPAPPKDEEVPFMLIRVMHTTILARIKRLKARNRHEVRMTAQDDAAEEPNRGGIFEFPADRKEEPEAKALYRELAHDTAEAFRQLKPHERQVLDAVFYQRKPAAAIAKERRCTRQYVEKLRDKALRQLRRLLGGTRAAYRYPVIT